MVDRALGAIIARIAHDRRLIRTQLLNLAPLEAISLVGLLLGDTLERFPADQRHGILAAFIEATHEG